MKFFLATAIISSISPKLVVPASKNPSEFAAAYCAWVQIRAFLARTDLDERQTGDALDKEQNAIWAVIQAPADQESYERRQRALFVQTLFNDAADRGRPTDNHHMIALAGMVTEILR